MELSEFITPFFEESFEMLDLMERDLQALDDGEGEGAAERLDSMFRVAHSIKGGAGTFGFARIADYALALEKLLEALRRGQCRMTTPVMRVMHESVEVLREMLNAGRVDGQADPRAVAAMLERIRQFTAGEVPEDGVGRVARDPQDVVSGSRGGVVGEQPGGAGGEHDAGAGETSSSSTADLPPPPTGAGWHILFRPSLDITGQGSDPLSILRDLAALGPLRSRVLDADLPTLRDLVPRHNYLGWEVELEADVPREQVEDVFAWVMDQAELTIEPLDRPDPVTASGIPVVTEASEALELAGVPEAVGGLPEPAASDQRSKPMDELVQATGVAGDAQAFEPATVLDETATFHEADEGRPLTDGIDRLIEELAGPLGDAAERMQSFTAGVRQGLALQVARQDEVLGGLTADMTELGLCARRQADSSALAADAAGQVRLRLERGGAAVGAALGLATQARQDAQGLVPVLQGLEGVTQQTGLLRVHVTLEAARLGESQGGALRGIAGELRALAEQGAAQLADGKALIRALSERMEEASRQLVEAKIMLDSLVVEAREMHDLITRVADTTDSHAKAVEAAAIAVAGLEGTRCEPSGWLDEAEEAGRGIEAQAEGLRRIVQELGASVRH